MIISIFLSILEPEFFQGTFFFACHAPFSYLFDMDLTICINMCSIWLKFIVIHVVIKIHVAVMNRNHSFSMCTKRSKNYFSPTDTLTYVRIRG